MARTAPLRPRPGGHTAGPKRPWLPPPPGTLASPPSLQGGERESPGQRLEPSGRVLGWAGPGLAGRTMQVLADAGESVELGVRVGACSTSGWDGKEAAVMFLPALGLGLAS